MILVDTNVVSEAMKLPADPGVLAWLDSQTPNGLYLSATSLCELLVGIEVLPAGRHKENLARVLDTLTNRLFQTRILPFDQAAAIAYATAVATARSKARIVSIADGQIAAIAAVHGFTVATRDTTPFLAAGVPVLNPWEE
jgi:predicted nucleic acid-binding protein